MAARAATPNAERLARGRAAAAAIRAAQQQQQQRDGQGGKPGPDAKPAKAAKRGGAALRILPLTAFAAALVLSVKVADLWERRDTLVKSITIGTVASAAAPEAQGPIDAPTGPVVTADSPEASRPIMQLAQADSTGSGEKVDPFNLGKSQIELLQSLADRRQELEAREQTIVQREGLLAAAEHRIDQKIGELNGIKAEIEDLIRKYDKQEEEQLASLVKIYETMKAKDAAKIFDALDMDILLQVIERMKASKTAPVLAAMTPERAKEVTARIAERRKMPDIN
ncbi:hypothetical protein T8K17_23360 [Thalassobaculum sp. OXR-137]|uniref:MotE family protein n=1 Tax=Thalassobaculum sp. OXR-137 TaxID=3100173 RepID=UPI002AC99A37|nr:hypothetical protein [Thalassobaculum sp. OXR-137]WPZ34158.1 hypothetical protein T8K17_23360 [Thalassobaculum sp. OXR-137]